MNSRISSFILLNLYHITSKCIFFVHRKLTKQRIIYLSLTYKPSKKEYITFDMFHLLGRMHFVICRMEQVLSSCQ